jgi:hypothetical protein
MWMEFKQFQMGPNVESHGPTHNWVFKDSPCCSPVIPTTFIGVVLNVGIIVHLLEAQCIHLFDKSFTQIHVKIFIKPLRAFKWY